MSIRRPQGRLREFVWVGGRVTALAAWPQIQEPWHHKSHRAVDVVGPMTPPGRASGRGDAGVYTDRRKRPLGAVLGHSCTLLRRCGQVRERRSVHRSAKMASRRGFGALVYTVAPARVARATVGTQKCTQIGENGLSEPFWGICVHCCVAGVARAAPSRGWRLHRGVNPHKPRRI